MSDVWAMRKAFQAVVDFIAPKAEATQGYIRHAPMGSDELVEWWEDFMYLRDLSDDIELQMEATGRRLIPGKSVENQLLAEMTQEQRLCLVGPIPFSWLWDLA